MSYSRCERMAPIAEFEASTSNTYRSSGLGSQRMGAEVNICFKEVNTISASEPQRNFSLQLVSFVSGLTKEEKFLMNFM